MGIRLIALLLALGFTWAGCRANTIDSGLFVYFLLWANFWWLRAILGRSLWSRWPERLQTAARYLSCLAALHLAFAFVFITTFRQDEAVSAAYNNQVLQLQQAIIFGADPNRVGWEEHDTPLTCAARYDNQKVARYLVLHLHVDVNRRNDFGQSALNAAQINGHEEMATFLTRYGAKR